jgi:hypothetical protein
MDAVATRPAFVERTDDVEVRARRVVAILLGVVSLGLIDLWHTLTYMRTVGMVELNPLARAMIDLGGERQLVLFKLFSIAVSCGVLYLIRRHRSAERCAWLSLLVMGALTIYWLTYNDHMLQVASLDTHALMADPRWTVIK